jgi:hypothetical protein
MIDIMMHLQTNYIPLIEKEATVHIESLQEEITLKTSECHKILFGGD